jgi:hypothetical protein
LYPHPAVTRLATTPFTYFTKHAACGEGRTARLHLAAAASTDAPASAALKLTRPSVRGQVADLFAEAIEKVFPGQVRRNLEAEKRNKMIDASAQRRKCCTCMESGRESENPKTC